MSEYSVAAIKARMGSTTYFQAVMTASELTATVRAAMDFVEFETCMEHDKMQRKLNEERVEREIVPYLTNSADRFFGSIIVLVYKPEKFGFEPISSFVENKFKGPYKGKDDQLGVLTIEGGDLFALDGQHRLHALRTVIQGDTTPHLKLPIKGEFKNIIASDELSVIFLEFESVIKARRIFNKVNRYAKPTSKSTNILTSEDDGYAIITRALIGDDDPDKFGGTVAPPLQKYYPNSAVPMIKIEGSSLSGSDKELFTLETIYAAVKSICVNTNQPSLDEKTTIVRPTDDVLAAAYDTCSLWWTELMKTFRPFGGTFRTPSHPVNSRNTSHTSSLAYRPVGQEVIINGLMLAHKKSRLSAHTLVSRLDAVPRKLASRPWIEILASSNGRVLSTNKALATNIMAWCLIGDGIGAKLVDEVEAGWREIHGSYPLPTPKD